jgi:hypothetical protein
MGCIPLMHDDDRIRLWSRSRDPSATSLVSRQCQLDLRSAWQVVAWGWPEFREI